MSEETNKWQKTAEISEEEDVAMPDPELVLDNPFLDEINRLKTEIQAEKDKVLRTLADMNNFRQRANEEIDKARKFGVEKMVYDLLPVLDCLKTGLTESEKATASLESIKQGSELTLKMFADVMQKFGVIEINPEGQVFDPAWHEVLAMQESESHAPNTVLSVVQPGYQLQGRLVRPAKVVIAKTKNPETQT